MKAKLFKVLDQYHLYDGDKAIATTIVGNPMLLPNLSKQNCDEIFGVVDVEKLATQHLIDKNCASLHTSWQGYNENTYKEGFNKAMELNKDKVFTAKSMLDFGEYVWKYGGKERGMNQLFDDFHDSKPTEITVEIVMEPCFYDDSLGGFSTSYTEDKPKEQPKLDSEGRLILKKI